VQQMLTLAGWAKPAENAKAIVDFETRLAEASWTRVERRDRDKTYNPATPAELNAMTPGVDWNRYLAANELPGVQRVVVTTNTAFPKFAKIYADTPLDTLKAWQAFHVADGAAPYLSKPFVDAHFQSHVAQWREVYEEASVEGAIYRARLAALVETLVLGLQAKRKVSA